MHYFPAVRVHESTVDSLSRGIAKRHSSHGGECGERIELVKDAIGRFERTPVASNGLWHRLRRHEQARVLDRTESRSQSYKSTEGPASYAL